MANPNTTPTRPITREASPPNREDRQDRRPLPAPNGPPDPGLEKRIERGDDESDDLTS
jgi:hypothetical protein